MKIKEPKRKYANVLLVDDNELDNFINEKTIEAGHFARKVYVATSAKSAIEFLSNIIVMGEKVTLFHPEIIFIDINMPLMDGFQFVEYFKKNLERNVGKTKLVILTSSIYQEDRAKAAAISKDIYFLNKPLTQEMLSNL